MGQPERTSATGGEWRMAGWDSQREPQLRGENAKVGQSERTSAPRPSRLRQKKLQQQMKKSLLKMIITPGGKKSTVSSP